MKHKIIISILVCFCLYTAVKAQGNKVPFSPTSLAVSKDGKMMMVAGKTANTITAFDIKKQKKKWSIETQVQPTGVVSGDHYLWSTLSRSEGYLLKVDPKTQEFQQISVGHGACAPVLHPIKPLIYIANQFNNDISVVDRNELKELKRIKVLRQPMAQDIRPDGKFLFVANFLTAGRADADTVTSAVSIIDLSTNEKIKDIDLANGSNALRGIKVSPDGKFVFISHNLGRFQVPTTQLEQGWMNTSAMSIIDAQKLEFVATVLLDDPAAGAAGSWGIDINDEYIFVAHSGTHDFSRINYKAFVEKLMKCSDKESLSYDLQFLYGVRQRFKVDGNGPRDLMVTDNKLIVANYFTDNIEIFDTHTPLINTANIELNKGYVPDIVRKGEEYFNDATYCFQGWQSCTGCHPNDARTDGLNWDLLNDGIGNQKNCKSMLYSHSTGPAMITGIRESAEVAVRAGFKYIQFAEVDEEHAKAVDEYLKSLRPVASPYLKKGALSEKAKEGEKIFQQANCNFCHTGEFFTDMKRHEMGRQGEYDHQNRWDTPTLVEVWRTGPYLHDGRSVTIKEVFTKEKHGLKNHDLTNDEVDSLVEYVKSL